MDKKKALKENFKEQYLELFHEEHSKENIELDAIRQFIKDYMKEGKTRQNFINEFLYDYEAELKDEDDFGTNPRTISNWINNKTNPSQENKEKLFANGVFKEKHQILCEEKIEELINEEEMLYNYQYTEIQLEDEIKETLLTNIEEINGLEISKGISLIYENDKFYLKEEKEIKGAAKDKFEATILSSVVFEMGLERAKKVLAKIERACSSTGDGGQGILSIDKFLDLHNVSTDISLRFSELFDYIYKQESNEGLDSITEYEKTLNIISKNLIDYLVMRKTLTTDID